MEKKNYYELDDSSTQFYNKAVIALTICLGLLGLYTIYTVFTTDIEWGFKINWNCFESPLFPILSVIGFFLQFFNWQHASMESWIGRKDSSGKVKWERNHDIIDNMFEGCLWPLLAHFLIIPCVYGAVMWYAIMGLLHVLGKLSPFFIGALVAVVVFFFYKWTSGFNTHKYRTAMLIALTIVGAALFGFTAYYMNNPGLGSVYSSRDKNIHSIGTCQITGNGVNLRHGPGTEYDKLGVMVSSGESYPLLEESEGWAKIYYNGSTAWLSTKFCNLIYDSGSNKNTVEEEDEKKEGMMVTHDDKMDQSVSYTTEPENKGIERDHSAPQQSTSQSELYTPSETESAKQSTEEETTDPTETMPIQEDNSVHTSVEQMAEFPGGIKALRKWLSANIRYPENAIVKDIQGRVVVKFVVEKDGSITYAEIVNHVDPDLDKEALRIVKSMPRWSPGKNGGVPVRSYFNLPVNFQIQEK